MAENLVRVRGTFDDKISSKIAKVRDNFDRLGKSGGFKALAQGVGLGIGQAAFNVLGGAAYKAGEFIGDSIDKASALNETLSKSRVIFGESARTIEDWGEGAAYGFGLSKQAAVEAAATFGNFFTGLGKSQPEAAAMSKRLVELAGDLASFNNLDPTDVLDKLRSGLTGEAEPLRRLGVFLNEGKVKAKAMELGLAGATGELTEGAKVAARYALILDETTTAQGDFARTAGEVANQQRILNAEIDDAQAALGERLLPVQKDATRAALDFLIAAGAIADSLSGKVTPESLAFARAMGKLSDEQFRAELAAVKHREALDRQANRARDYFPKSIDKATQATKDLGDETKTTTQLIKDLVAELSDAADKAIADYYDPIEIRQELLVQGDERRALRTERADKTTNRARRREIDLTLTHLERRSDELNLALLETGQMATGEWTAWMGDLRDRIQEAKGPAKTALQEIYRAAQKLRNIQISVSVNLQARATSGVFVPGAGTGPPSLSGLAHGGYAPPGWSGWVGEEGPERMVALPGGGAYVTPTPAGKGGTQVIQLVVDGRVLAEVVDEELHRKFQRAAPTKLTA